MTRKEFIKMCGILGIGLPIVKSCNPYIKALPISKTGKVVIIGAGAAGLTAAYLLEQKGVSVEVLEASSNYGGRMKRTKEFADFPIPTGAEWLHTKRKVLDEIVNDKEIKIQTVTKSYDTDNEYALIDGKREELKVLGFTIDQKFIDGTWFDFYDEYVVPRIKNRIRFGQIVKSIDYINEKIKIETESEEIYADRIILTAPVKILQNSAIKFIPELPVEKFEAIKNVVVWGGCKAFIEFKEKFYPAATGFENIPQEQGHKLFYDASYGQNTNQHILGVFAVGPVSKPYTDKGGDNLKSHLLKELDQVFDGKATPNYKRHIFQNWTDEPFIKSAYVHYFESWRNIRKLAKPIEDKIYFAGDAYTDGSEWSSVHAAAKSAKNVVQALIG